MSIQSAADRREQNRADARRTILDATESLLLELGEEGFSVRKLVLRCGYSAPTIYHYFGDKNGLIDALLEERFAQLVDDLRGVRRGEDPIENLRAMARAFAHFGLCNPTHYQLVTQPRARSSEPLPSAEEARRLIEEPLGELARRGLIALGDPEAARQSIWAHLHGLISLQATRPDIEWHADLLELSLESIVRGWLRPLARDPMAACETSQHRERS